MAVGLKVKNIVSEIGSADFLHAFFSTASKNLEPKGWGSRFPVLMDRLYKGQLAAADVGAAISEMNTIRQELKAISPDMIVWDIEDSTARPPWGDRIGSEITDLSNYFVTSTGRDFIHLILESLEFAQEEEVGVSIEQI